MSHQLDFYQILEVSPSATEEDILIAAKRLSSRFPEEARDPVTNDAFKRLLTAYETLSDPERRAVYDRQLKAPPPGLLETKLEASRPSVTAMEGDQLLYLLLDLRSPKQEEKEDLPVNVCLVIDRSTSMKGNRLAQVKAAAKLVVEKLGPKDVISVISFSDRAKVVSPAGRIHNRALLSSRISTMVASGGTEIYQGLKAGVAEMTKVDLGQYVNKLVLLTDGHTYGDSEECLQLAKESAAQGIMFSALGIGTDWNDEFLDQLVSPSAGSSQYIEKPDQIVSYLEEQIEGLGTVYARNVRLTLDLPEGVNIKYVIKLAPFAQPLSTKSNSIKLGPLEGRAPLTILFEVTLSELPLGRALPMKFSLLADIPSKNLEDEPFEEEVTVAVVGEAEKVIPPAGIVRAVQMLNLYRMNERVWEEVEAGQLEMATKRMSRISTRLMQAGQTKLAKEAMQETHRLAQIGTLSEEGRKKLKYGTRSLLTKTMSLMDNHDSV